MGIGRGFILLQFSLGASFARVRHRRLTLDQLRIFVVVAEQQHVTRASYALNMAQSAVSKAIATLESEVGFRLFDRIGRNIRLTREGAEFRDRAVDLLYDAEQLLAWAIEKTRDVGRTP